MQRGSMREASLSLTGGSATVHVVSSRDMGQPSVFHDSISASVNRSHGREVHSCLEAVCRLPPLQEAPAQPVDSCAAVRMRFRPSTASFERPQA